MSRGRSLLLSGFLLLLAALLLAIAALSLFGEGKSRLGDATFDANASFLARSVRENGPVLFPDLDGRTRDIYVQHVGDDLATGWFAIKATAPGAARTCTLEWDRAAALFRDTRCGTAATFPADGTGLERWQATVVGENRLVVDFRVPVP